MIFNRIQELNEKDRIRKEKEIAQNSLETFILDVQDKLSQEEFQALVKEDERTQILEKSSEVSHNLLHYSTSLFIVFGFFARFLNGFMTMEVMLKQKNIKPNYKFLRI